MDVLALKTIEFFVEKNFTNMKVIVTVGSMHIIYMQIPSHILYMRYAGACSQTSDSIEIYHCQMYDKVHGMA